MTTIQARGEHESHHVAERATITARISIASEDRERSIAEATALHGRIMGIARDLREQGAATWHAGEPIRTYGTRTYREGKSRRVVIEHRTTSAVRVKVSDLEQVSTLVTLLAEMGATTDVDWSLTEASRREHEKAARRSAVRVAREIAGDYAEALGERVGLVVSISDVPGGGAIAPMAASMRMVAGGAGAVEAAEVTIAEITVRAEVTGLFETVPLDG
ncbi:SIMPL domain-containing protein [Brachybacterium sp. DNPG3]